MAEMATSGGMVCIHGEKNALNNLECRRRALQKAQNDHKVYVVIMRLNLSSIPPPHPLQRAERMLMTSLRFVIPVLWWSHRGRP